MHLVVILCVLVVPCVCCTVYWSYYIFVVRCIGCTGFLLYRVLLYCVLCTCRTVCIDVFTLDAGLLAKSQYSEGPATGHFNTGFTWFPCVCLQANAQMVPNIPSCHYMLLM